MSQILSYSSEHTNNECPAFCRFLDIAAAIEPCRKLSTGILSCFLTILLTPIAMIRGSDQQARKRSTQHKQYSKRRSHESRWVTGEQQKQIFVGILHADYSCRIVCKRLQDICSQRHGIGYCVLRITLPGGRGCDHYMSLGCMHGGHIEFGLQVKL